MNNRPGRAHDLVIAETQLARELHTNTWAALGRHNHYFLALVLSRLRADIVKMAANGLAVKTIATHLGVTPERVEDDIEAALEKLDRYCETRPHWLPWCVSYTSRVRANVTLSFL